MISIQQMYKDYCTTQGMITVLTNVMIPAQMCKDYCTTHGMITIQQM